jgi:hypothetical protein
MAKTPWFRGILRGQGLSLFLSNATTAGTQLKFQGVQTLYSTSAGKAHTLRAPARVGDTVSLVCKKGTTTNTATVLLPTGWSFQKTSNSTGTNFRKATFNAGNQSLTLVALTTARIGILSNVNTVTIGTS